MEPSEVLAAGEIDLADPVFWTRPLEEREGAFLTLRRERPVLPPLPQDVKTHPRSLTTTGAVLATPNNSQPRQETESMMEPGE